ncbi:hypothetical protein ACFC06_00585 [Nocardia sp. NPDC056064]|uniref:hypothetical protein n=1 Tax=Nocardia sp. NPDC056064 TaxID=3345701 RepID=UPI0035D80EF0
MTAPPDLAAALTEDGFDVYDGNLRGEGVVEVVFWAVEHRETIAHAVAETTSVVIATRHVVNAIAAIRKWVLTRWPTPTETDGAVYFIDRDGRRIPIGEWLASNPDDADLAARIDEVLQERRDEIPPSQG